MALRSRPNGLQGFGGLAARARELSFPPLTLRVPLSWTEAAADVLATFIVVKLGFYLAAAFGLWMVPEFARPWTPSAFFTTPEIVNVLYHWDGEWYVWIAEHGYELKATGFSPVAFFPLLPALINLTGRLFAPEHLPYAGVIVVNLAFLAAMFYLYALAVMDAGRGHAQRALWFMSILPAAFFFHVVYTESLFLLTAAATVYHARRGQLWLAGLWALIASLGRVQGLLLGLIIAWEVLRLWRAGGGVPWRVVLTPLLPLLGLAIYMAHLYSRFGEPFAFVQAQAAWARVYTLPLVTVWEAIRVLLWGRSGLGDAYGLEALNTLTVFAFVVVAVASARRWPAAYNLYVFPALLVALSTPVEGRYLMSGARFMAVLFPVSFALAAWSETRPNLGRGIMVVCLPLFGLLTALFVAFREVY